MDSKPLQTKWNPNARRRHPWIILAIIFTVLLLRSNDWVLWATKCIRHRHSTTYLKSNVGNDPFHWERCSLSRDARYLCGYLNVPLDYTNNSDPRIVKLATTMYLAQEGRKSARTLVINPGGPGGSGTNYVWRKGEEYNKNLTDGQYDVLGWDPRGVNLTDPHMSCFPKDAYRDRWSALTERWPETGGYEATIMADAMNEAKMAACLSRYGDIPRFLTTAFVARDMDAIREALGEEELTALLISYGTGVGQTYTQMFPHRVGRIIMDGMEYVVDGRVPWGWGTTSLDNVTAAWKDGFIGECVEAGPSRCALAPSTQSSNLTSMKEALVERMDHLFTRVAKRPLPGFTDTEGPGIVTYESVIQVIYGALYDPSSWPKTARLLKELDEGNATLALTAIGKNWSYDPEEEVKQENQIRHPMPTPKTQSEELTQLVICGDSYDADQKPLEWWESLRQNMTQQSFISGSPRLFTTLPCRHFSWKSAEVYRGGFNATLKHPVLLIGEIYDPATPLRNGRALAKEMGHNAKLIVHHGYGHSSNRDPSQCTAKIMHELFMNGTLPNEEETDCFADQKPFPAGGEDDEVWSWEEFRGI